jgi:hypothetical protein
MKLFHLTKEVNLHKILTEGLRINTRRTCFTTSQDRLRYHRRRFLCQPIWTTPDIVGILSTQLTKDFCAKHNIHVIELSNDLSKDIEVIKINDLEYICPENIPTKYILKVSKLEDLVDLEEIFEND